MIRRYELFSLAAILLLLGCNKIAPYKEKGDPRLASLEAICAKVASLPPLAVDGVKPVDLRYGLGSEKRNVVWMHLEEMPCRESHGAVPLRMIEMGDFNWVPAVSFLKGGTFGNETESEIKAAFDRFFAIEHVVVIKTTSVKAPSLTDVKSFEPGAMSGEAHVFTIAGAVHHGGVRFAATNASKVSVEVFKSDDGLRKDLGSSASSAASRALARQLPARK